MFSSIIQRQRALVQHRKFGEMIPVLDYYQDEQIFHAVKQVIISSLHGWPQPLVVEGARSGLGHAFRPGLSELLDALRGR